MKKNYFNLKNIGCIVLGGYFIFCGILNFFSWKIDLTVLVTHHFFLPNIALWIATIAQIILGFLLMIPHYQKISAVLLILFTLTVAPVFLDFWNQAGPEKMNSFIIFLGDIAIIAGLLIVTGSDQQLPIRR
jgi:uncharacterized membrane protein YphA (DoxX/SURF4 family)